MPREVPLERVLEVRQRQEAKVVLEAAQVRARFAQSDSPYYTKLRRLESRRQERAALSAREAAFSDPACFSPRLNVGAFGLRPAAPRPSPRHRAAVTARILPDLPNAARLAASQSPDKIQHGRVPTELARLHELIGIVLSKAARAAEASEYRTDGGLSAKIASAAGEAIAAANAHVVARERPEVSLPSGAPERGAVRRAERRARQSANDMKELRRACQAHSELPRVQLLQALMGWSGRVTYSPEQTIQCLRWLAWLESSTPTPQQLTPRGSAPSPGLHAHGAREGEDAYAHLPVRSMKMEYVENVLNLMLHLGLARRWQTSMLLHTAKEERWVAHSRLADDEGKPKTLSVDVDRLLLLWTQMWDNWEEAEAAATRGGSLAATVTGGRGNGGVTIFTSVPPIRAKTAPLIL